MYMDLDCVMPEPTFTIIQEPWEVLVLGRVTNPKVAHARQF